MNPPTLPGLFDVPIEPLPRLDPVARVIAAVAQKAEDTRPDFTRDACAFVVAYLGQHGPTSGEALTLAAKAAGIVPHDDRAFGAVYLRLSKSRQIVRVGFTARERGHGTQGGSIWDLAKRA